MPEKRQDRQNTYTRPRLRTQLKDELKASDKGAPKGRWSARKSQLLALEYEKQGGRFKGPKTRSQRSLDQWTAQEWQTVKGSARAREAGKMHRYLPRQVWEMLSAREREQAERTKLGTDAKGQQFAHWPRAVEKAMTAAGLTGKNPSTLRKSDLVRYAENLQLRRASAMDRGELENALRQKGSKRKSAP